MTVYPIFYDNFKCKAGDCSHSCCMGWEIDVDDDTAVYYKEIDSPFGDKLNDSMYCDKEGYHFRLDEAERCRFLREDGLCDIILTLGEDALCDICALHPRFYFDAFGVEFAGLGACCEAVCEEVLKAEESKLFMDDGGNYYSLNELMKGIIPDKNFNVEYTPDWGSDRLNALLNIFEKTEPIDELWNDQIESLKKKSTITYEPDICVLRKIFAFIFYRQIERIPEYGVDGVICFSNACTDFIAFFTALTSDYAESFRRFSEQIEYSTENVDILFESISPFYKSLSSLKVL